MYRWLSACALYPRLEWILTIRLGRALGLYTDESRLLRLIRLPWFRQGEMPLELQQDLVEAMTKERTVAAARAALRKLLEEAREVAKDASGAGAAGFEIAVQRLGLTPLERRALRRDMAVARQPLRGDKGWLPELPARLSLMLFGGSKWMALRSRWLLALLGAFVLLGMVGFLGVQGFGEIRQKYAGPSVAEVRGEESRLTLREPVRLIRFSGNGQRMVVAGASGEVLVADASGRRLATVSYPGSPSEIVAGYDGATVVIGGSAGVYTSRLSAGVGEVRAWVRGELIGNTSARDELIAVKEDGGTVRLYFQNTRRFDLPADTRKLLWSGPGQGWIETARGVQRFEIKGTGLQLGEPLSGSQTMLAGLNSNGMPVLAPRDGKSGSFTTKGFARAFANGAPAHQLVAGDFFVWNTDSKSSLYPNEIEIDALDNDAGERHAFASPVTALGYDPISRRIAVGLWSGRIEFLPAQFAKVRVNPKDGLPYSYISPGKFPMGCSKGDLECNSTDEGKTPHDVEITRGFWLGQTEVTQAAYKKVTGKDPSIFKGADRPVENVSWDEASAFCTQAGLRLPAEAEWEYAARAGNADARYGPIDRIAWYDKTSSRGTQPVAGKLPNAWGLYDMLGNVFEWVADWYDAGYYDQKVGRDPKGPSKGDGRAMRGGSWSVDSQNARASYRLGYDPSDRNGGIGFRCAGELP